MTDKGISEEIGRRVRSLRLRRNLTQQQVAHQIALSLNSVKSLEAGKGKLSTLIAVLRELGGLDAVESFIPEPSIRPLQLVRQQGKERHRASGKRLKTDDGRESEW